MKRFYDPIVEEVRNRGRKFTTRYENNPKKIMKILKKSYKQQKEIVAK